MKNELFYFKHNDSEVCYNKAYFNDYIKRHKLTEIDVFEAIPERIGGGVFWCKEHLFCGDGTNGTCGKSNCKEYEPRNKVNGCCKYHTSRLYTHGDKITLAI